MSYLIDSFETDSIRSLEWDCASEATSPSFLQQEGIDMVGAEAVHAYSTRSIARRKNTSTDCDVLEERPNTVVGLSNWPPREPSQEPDQSLTENYISVQRAISERSLTSEVFDIPISSTMDEEIYKTKLPVVFRLNHNDFSARFTLSYPISHPDTYIPGFIKVLQVSM